MTFLKNCTMIFGGIALPFFVFAQTPPLETLQTVTDRNSTTTNSITVGGGGVNGNGTKVYINNPYGKMWALSAGTNYIHENHFGIYNWSDNTTTPYFTILAEGNVGIGTGYPNARLDVNGGIRASGNTAVTVDGPLTNASYQTGNFQAYVTPAGYQNGARPGYGFHAGNTLGMYLYANTENQLRIKNGSNADYEVWHSGNFDPNTKISASYLTGNNDMNSFLPPGLYEYETADGTIANSPLGNAQSSNFKVLSLGASSRQAQLAFTTGSNDVWIRNIYDWGGGRTFLPWAQLYTSANFSPSNYLPLAGGNITGNVGIGAENTSIHKLAVNGSAIFKKVVVKNSSLWPDYVFDSSYHLLPLEQLASYITKEKHLPGIPAASTVEKEGHDLGEMQQLLLKKMEEMTLYMIELKKENVTLRHELQELKNGK